MTACFAERGAHSDLGSTWVQIAVVVVVLAVAASGGADEESSNRENENASQNKAEPEQRPALQLSERVADVDVTGNPNFLTMQVVVELVDSAVKGAVKVTCDLEAHDSSGSFNGWGTFDFGKLWPDDSTSKLAEFEITGDESAHRISMDEVSAQCWGRAI
jgi:hypothetical protein